MNSASVGWTMALRKVPRKEYEACRDSSHKRHEEYEVEDVDDFANDLQSAKGMWLR